MNGVDIKSGELKIVCALEIIKRSLFFL